MTSWWGSKWWLSYECAYGDEPGTRSRLLASAGWATRVIDLARDERLLWRDVRKSYKALIHRTERDYRILPAALGPHVLVRACHALHRQAAGRETRPIETWQLMESWAGIDLGAPLVLAKRGGNSDPVAFAYFLTYGAWAYYGYAASLIPDANAALIWAAMRTLKARGVACLEMGWQEQATNKKGLAIEFFRRGFGGKNVPANWLARQEAHGLQPIA